MFESQQSQMHVIWLGGTVDPEARLQARNAEDRAETPPVPRRVLTILRRLFVRHRQICAAACEAPSLPPPAQSCC